MRRIAYLRVSTAEQTPARQIEGLKDLADELEIETLSAVARRRPVYEGIVERLRPGDALVIWDIDRAYRSAKDALNELDALDRRGINFVIAKLAIDTSTAEGYFMYTIMSGAAEFERRILSRRTKEGIAAARESGKRIGRPPKLTALQLFEAHYRIVTKQATRVEIANEHGIAPWTLTRAINRSLQTPAN